MNAPTNADNTETYRLTTGDGTLLHVYRWLPASAPRAMVQIAHGMGEHAGRYAWAAQRLNQAGYGVYANDHRGHGETATPDSLGWMGEDGWRHVVTDAGELSSHIEERHPGLPLVLLGHSMGALLAQQYLYRYGARLSAAVLSGSPGWPARLQGWLSRSIAGFERWRLGSDGDSALLQSLLFGKANADFDGPAATGYEWLSRDPAQVSAYVQDPLCGFVLRAGNLHELFESVRSSRQIDNLLQIPRSLPVYVLSGADDPIHDRERNLSRLLAAYREQLDRLDYRLYPGGRHELLNETNRQEVVQDLLAWLDSVLPEAPPANSATAPSPS